MVYFARGLFYRIDGEDGTNGINGIDGIDGKFPSSEAPPFIPSSVSAPIYPSPCPPKSAH